MSKSKKTQKSAAKVTKPAKAYDDTTPIRQAAQAAGVLVETGTAGRHTAYVKMTAPLGSVFTSTGGTEYEAQYDRTNRKAWAAAVENATAAIAAGFTPAGQPAPEPAPTGEPLPGHEPETGDPGATAAPVTAPTGETTPAPEWVPLCRSEQVTDPSPCGVIRPAVPTFANGTKVVFTTGHFKGRTGVVQMTGESGRVFVKLNGTAIDAETGRRSRLGGTFAEPTEIEPSVPPVVPAPPAPAPTPEPAGEPDTFRLPGAEDTPAEPQGEPTPAPVAPAASEPPAAPAVSTEAVVPQNGTPKGGRKKAELDLSAIETRPGSEELRASGVKGYVWSCRFSDDKVYHLWAGISFHDSFKANGKGIPRRELIAYANQKDGKQYTLKDVKSTWDTAVS